MSELKGKLNPAPIIGFDKKPAQYYKGIKAMSDTDLHEQLVHILGKITARSGIAEKKPEVLDLGCGEGAFSQRLFDSGFSVTAVDVNRGAFKAKGPVFTAVDLNNNAEREDFISRNQGKYDIIFAVEVIEHVKNPWELVSFIKRLSREGAEIFITTPNFASWWGRVMFLLSGELWGFDGDAWENPGHINPVSATELTRILSANGFRLNKIYPCGKLPVIWLFNWKRTLVSLLMLPLYLLMKGQKNGWALCFHATSLK